MILITGGAYQGKSEYVRKAFSITQTADGADCDFDAVISAACVSQYHALVKRLMKAGIDPTEFTERFCRENPAAIVMINEIGSGIIPMEKDDRLWREAVGRCGCILAQKSDTVLRVICGIPHALKGELP